MFLLLPGADGRFQCSKATTKGSLTRVCFAHSGSTCSLKRGTALSQRELKGEPGLCRLSGPSTPLPADRAYHQVTNTQNAKPRKAGGFPQMQCRDLRTNSTIVKASERKGDKINTLVPEMGREQTPLCDLCLESWDAQSGASQICHGAEADYTEVIPVHAKL